MERAVEATSVNAGRQDQLGMGVRFVGLGEEDARRIREFVRGSG